MSINKIFSLSFLLLSFVLIVNLGRDVLRLIRTEERLAKTEERLQDIKEQNERFGKTKDYYQSNEFLEEQIRDKLQMAKPGETVLILPEQLQEASSTTFKKEEKKEKTDLANWQKWLGLFK